MSKLVISPR